MTEESDTESLGGDSGDETQDQPITIDRIRSWLLPTSSDDDNGEYRKHLASLQPGTGAWLTASPEYHAWLNGSDQGLLWVQGVPGSGKSVLAAKLVHEISLSGVPVLYFFFRQIIDTNQTPGALLRDWLDQILPHSDRLQKRLQKEVCRSTNLDNLGTEGLWKLLRLALGSLQGRAYCIVDALDEMNKGNSQFLRELSDLGCFQPSKVRVLVTSRPVADVTNTLRAMPTSQIRRDADIVDRDISTFVRHCLAASELSTEDQDRIHQAIPGHRQRGSEIAGIQAGL